MDLSGIIFVVLAVAWAVYLIPKALKHHDEVARTRSIDRFSGAMRVLARREPISRSDSRLVVTPARAVGNPRVVVPTPPVRAAASRNQPDRAAARVAARRRRRILIFLLLCTAAVTGLAGFAVVPWWSVTIPAGVSVLYLVVCRVQVRRMQRPVHDATTRPASEEATSAPVRGGVRVDVPYGAVPRSTSGPRHAQGLEEADPDEDTVTIPVPVLDEVALPAAAGSVWDPLPVTLPTYVTKPKAKRTVRTIDLGEPGTWSSGRTAEDAQAAASAGEGATADEGASERSEPLAADSELETPRAVGS